MIRSTPNWLYVEEQWDDEGMLWVVPQLGIKTHDRGLLDRLADLGKKELHFNTIPIGS